jgi:hypothetical protein
MDQLLEDLHKLVEEKNAANLVAALASCSVDWRGGVVTQFKLVNLAAPSTTTAPKVIPPISDPSSMVTLEQVQKMIVDPEAEFINRFTTMQHNADLKKPIHYAPVIPSGSTPVSSAPKTTDFL